MSDGDAPAPPPLEFVTIPDEEPDEPAAAAAAPEPEATGSEPEPDPEPAAGRVEPEAAATETKPTEAEPTEPEVTETELTQLEVVETEPTQPEPADPGATAPATAPELPEAWVAEPETPAPAESTTGTPRDPEAVISGADLVKRYGTGAGAVNALNGVSINLYPATFTAIMGPSGSGKSTLMHLLAGLDTPSEGEVWIGPTRLTGLRDGDLTRLRRNRIGFVFQSFNLLGMLDVEQNITLPQRLAGQAIDRDWLDWLLAAIGLGDRRRARPAELSGGEQQRVSLARALLGRPAVVFADEPTGNLDSRNSDIILTMLRRAVEDLGQTIVIVTHDAAAAERADRIVRLADGRIVDPA